MSNIDSDGSNINFSLARSLFGVRYDQVNFPVFVGHR